MCLGCEYHCCPCYHCRTEERYLKYACFKCHTTTSRHIPKYDDRPNKTLYFKNPDAKLGEPNIIRCTFEPKPRAVMFKREAICPICNDRMTRLGPADEIPKKNDLKGWKLLESKRSEDYDMDLYKHLDREGIKYEKTGGFDYKVIYN